MKAYNKYMDTISVSSALHRKIVTCAVKAEHGRRPIMAKRYAMAFACLVVAVLGIFTVPQFMQHNITPTPGDNPSVLQPGLSTAIPSVSSKYTLDFNKANSQTAADIAIAGHFWQELTSDELKAIFPEFVNTHAITATANFSSGENGAALFNIDAHAVSVSGLKSYIQIAPGEVVLDYRFDSETKISDVLGTAVMAGYFETEPNSKGLRNIIYFASFKLSDVAYYAELGGAETEKEALKDEISGLIGFLIKGGAADLSIFDNPTIPVLPEDALNLK
jgi:hypothetical protein